VNKKCGKILLTGFSNAGKSTLINALLRKKVSIVSHKVQTTNKKIKAVLNYDFNQLIFVDTPGIITTKKFFDKHMSRTLFDDVKSFDLNIFIFDSSRALNEELIENIRKVTSFYKKNFLALNKIDLVDRESLLSKIKKINEKIDFTETFPISAKKKRGIDILLQKIIKNIPSGEWLFKDNKISTEDFKFQLSEITREKIFRLTNKEIPYSVTIQTTTNNLKNLIKINQTIFVKKKSQKPILIGKAGEKIKHIGTEARLEIQKRFKKKVFLDIKVSNK
jgi:GTP-binding protein Era